MDWSWVSRAWGAVTANAATWSPVATALGVVWWGSRRQYLFGWKSKLAEQKRELYAELIILSDQTLNYVVFGTAKSNTECLLQRRRAEVSLRLLEDDEDLLALITALEKAIPEVESDDAREASSLAVGDPGWEWPPYEKAREALVIAVRKKLSKP